MSNYPYDIFSVAFMYTVSKLAEVVVVLVLSVVMAFYEGLTAGGGALVNILIHHKHNE